MMIATILLVVNLVFLAINGEGFMSFWHFLWIYPVEITIYIIMAIIWTFIVALTKGIWESV